MNQLGFASNFTELLVYKKARKLSYDIYIQSRNFPKTETYSLTDQILRSSRSVGAQIAEAWSLRRYKKMFISRLCISDGELHETIHWIEIARDCGYFDQSITKNLRDQSLEIGRMIGSMIKNPDRYCDAFSELVQDQDNK